MADINVMQSDGQEVVKPTTDVTVAEIGSLTSFSTLPNEFDHMIRLAAANGKKMLASISHTLMLADAITAVNTARSDLVAMFNTAITTLTNGKLDKPTGSTSQYMRGDGTLATFPSSVDISGKSDKSQFAALSTLAAHGRSNGATNNPTNSKTDYNVVTTLLGSLTDGLNQTNTAQNTIGTNLNALSTQFNALLTWLGTNKDAINSLKTAGAT